MKIYLASNFNDHKQMVDLKNKLEFEGQHKVVSSWHTSPALKLDHDYKDDPNEFVRAEVKLHALRDLREIDLCDCFVVDLTNITHTGGKHVEFGYAMYKGKILFTIGEASNIFHELATHNFVDIDEAVKFFRG